MNTEGQSDNVLNSLGNTSFNESTEAVLVSMVTQLFTIAPTIVILLCQVGFAMVESGASRVESAAVPFVTNILVFGTSCLSFWAIGYALAKSDGLTALGYRQWFSHDFEPEFSVDWLLHFSLALTTTNIATYGGLERCPIYVYCIVSPIVTGVICGLCHRWAWHHDSWAIVHSPFEGVAYKDQGGSGAIHMVGGSSALTISLLLGPRYSRIRDPQTQILYNDIDGHSLPLEMIGWYFYFVCFLCCNCVRLPVTCVTCQPISNKVARAAINSIIAAATSALSTTVLIHLMKTLLGKKRFHYLTSRQLANGLLVGLISVGAGCDVFPHWASFLVGVTSGVGYVIWCQLLYFAEIDDPFGTIAVHLGGGLWGVMTVHLFREKTGLVFADNSSVPGLALVWNIIVALCMVGCSVILTGLSLITPRVLGLIPVKHGTEIQGADAAFLGQQAYPSGNTVTPFTTDVIEDHERFIHSNLTSPETATTSPTSYSFTGLRSDNLELPGQNDLESPYRLFDLDLKSLPSFTRSPGETDRRVWFNRDILPDQVAPMTPVDFYDLERNRWDDVEF